MLFKFFTSLTSLTNANIFALCIAVAILSVTSMAWGKSYSPEVKLLTIETPETTKSCPNSVETLTNKLLKDLPDYSNRVLKRTQDSHLEAGIDTYIVTAGQPELEPLNLPQIKYDPTDPEDIEQIFFTTLERQYQNQQKIERESYHWLFVTMADDGWYLVTMFSRFGDANKNTPPTPPVESSDGIIGQAVSLWLRDCRAFVSAKP